VGRASQEDAIHSQESARRLRGTAQAWTQQEVGCSHRQRGQDQAGAQQDGQEGSEHQEEEEEVTLTEVLLIAIFITLLILVLGRR
jgi:hypothetical protein